MNINNELKDEREAELVAILSSAYTLLALCPFDSWGHEGTPAQMAAYIVKTAKDRGSLGFLYDVFGLYRNRS